MKKLLKSLHKFYVLNKKGWILFGVFLLIYLIWCALPSIYHLLITLKIGVIIETIKFLYGLIKGLLSTLVTGVFFYLIVDAWNEKIQTKNELNYIRHCYKEMKKDILEDMVLSSYDYAMPPRFDKIINEHYLSPKMAQTYFSQDRFQKMVMSLDDKSWSNIVRKIGWFLEKFDHISYKFLKNGDPAIINVFDSIQDLKFKIEDINESRAINWAEASTLKSFNPLYLLFCNEIDGEDPFLKKLNEQLDKFL